MAGGPRQRDPLATDGPRVMRWRPLPYWINPKPFKIKSYATCLFKIHLKVNLHLHIMTTSVTSRSDIQTKISTNISYSP